MILYDVCYNIVIKLESIAFPTGHEVVFEDGHNSFTAITELQIKCELTKNTILLWLPLINLSAANVEHYFIILLGRLFMFVLCLQKSLAYCIVVNV